MGGHGPEGERDGLQGFTRRDPLPVGDHASAVDLFEDGSDLDEARIERSSAAGRDVS